MKRIFTFLGIFSIGISGITQTTVPNAGFETWSNVAVLDSIQGWTTSTLANQLVGIPVDNSYLVGSAYAGSYAVHLETVFWNDPQSGLDDTLFAYIIKDNVNSGFRGFPYSDTVNVFNGWYKSDISAGDSAVAIVQLSKAGTIYSADTLWFTGVQNSWTQFTIPLTNGAGIEPDSVFVGFASSDPFNPGVALEGSWLEVDDVSFDYTVGSMTAPSAIPDNSFEAEITESVEELDGWFSFNSMLYAQFDGASYATKSTDKTEGLFSLRLETTITNFVEDIPALVTNGTYDMGIDDFIGGDAFNAQPDQMTGQYKYTPSGTDTAWVIVEMWNAGTGTLVSADSALSAAANWTQFTIDLNLTEAPDSVLIILYSGDNTGSIFYVDDLQFIGGDIGLNEVDKATDWSYYPNPSVEQITVTTNKANSIEIIDISGQVVYKSSNLNESKNIITTANWANGIYFIKVNQNNKVTTKKLIVRH